jgi:flagellar hook-associated protein FlgK
MSATSELLAEQIRDLETQINEKTNRGENVVALKEQRNLLLKELARANQALNEGKGVLKG